MPRDARFAAIPPLALFIAASEPKANAATSRSGTACASCFTLSSPSGRPIAPSTRTTFPGKPPAIHRRPRRPPSSPTAPRLGQQRSRGPQTGLACEKSGHHGHFHRSASRCSGQEDNGEIPGARPRIDFNFLRQQVSMEEVLKHLGILDRLRGRGHQRRGPCPLHSEPANQTASFSVHLGKKAFQCFHAECRAQGNVLDLWAAIHRLPLYEAAIHLAGTFQLAVNREEEPVSIPARVVKPPAK